MANREALRELQTRLAERMQAARREQRGQSWLAVECRGHGLLLPLEQAGEIFPPSSVMPVPHTQSWFVGVANLRGGLHGVVDLARFLGLPEAPSSEPGREQSRLVAFGTALGLNSALLVDRLAGLRSSDQMKAAPADGAARPAFAGAVWLDATQRPWQSLDLARLAQDEHFLSIVARADASN
jgi:twitching motility protein PilI